MCFKSYGELVGILLVELVFVSHSQKFDMRGDIVFQR